MTVTPQEKIKILFNLESMNSETALDIVIAALSKLKLPECFQLNENTISTSELRKILNKSLNKWPSRVTSNGLLFKFSKLPSLNFSFMTIEELNLSRTDWNILATHVANLPGFIQAWTYNAEYDYWQNATDPLEYENTGRSTSHLPKKSNDLPPPLEQLEIDTSQNPGRTKMKKGYIEAVAATMWLSNEFWCHTGKNKIDELLEAPWLKITKINNNTIKLTACENSFCDTSTASTQDTLRKMIFG